MFLNLKVNFKETANSIRLLAVIQMSVRFTFETAGCSLRRVSMGLTVRRKTAKNLAVRRKNERILAVSRKKN